LSLDGLSIGDAFGQQFFSPHVAANAKRSTPPPPPWNYTDDTEMAIALTETLRDCESIDQDFLAQRFVERYQSEPSRGYGAGARRLLIDIACHKSVRLQICVGAANRGEGCGSTIGLERAKRWTTTSQIEECLKWQNVSQNVLANDERCGSRTPKGGGEPATRLDML